jgi:NNP family nitrate/nitrite transporter-like MFS transporter
MPEQINLFSFNGRMHTLHAIWIAFFLTFVMWFNPLLLLALGKKALWLRNLKQMKTLLILNQAFITSAWIVIGILADKISPKALYPSLV